MKNIPTQSTSVTLDPDDFNEIPTEIENSITDSGQTLDTSDLFQLSQAISAYAAGGAHYTDSGAADAYVLSPVGSKQSPEDYFVGMLVRFRPSANNTGASTINVNSLGLKNIKQSDGSNDPIALEINTSDDIVLVYDGTSFIILNSVKGKLTLKSSPSGTPVADVLYKDNVIKAWIALDGTGAIAIDGSFNVSSIVDQGVGEYDVNWDRDFANINYALAVTGVTNQASFVNVAVGSVRISTSSSDGTAADASRVCAIAIGDQ